MLLIHKSPAPSSGGGGSSGTTINTNKFVAQNGYGTNLTFIGNVYVGDGTQPIEQLAFVRLDGISSAEDFATFSYDLNGFSIYTSSSIGSDTQTINLLPGNGRVVINGSSSSTPINTLDMTGDIALSGNLNFADGSTTIFDGASSANINENSPNSVFINSQGNINNFGTGTIFDTTGANFNNDSSTCLFSNNAYANQNWNSTGSTFESCYDNINNGSSGSTFSHSASANMNFYSGNCVFYGGTANENFQSDTVVFTNSCGGNVNRVNPGSVFNNCFGVDISGNGSSFSFTNETSLKASAGYYFLGDPYAVRQTTAYTPTNPVAAQYITGKVPNSALNFNANPHIPTAVTLTGSVFTFSNATPNVLECYFSGSVAYAVSKNGAGVFGSLASDGYMLLQPTNKVAITYTVAPTFFTNSMF